MLVDWLRYIEKMHPQTIALGLDRVRSVARKLNILQFSSPVITVGGTNGKGSCIAILESILSNSDYQVGAYTSPHLIKFNERIRINQQMIDDESLSYAFEVVDKARENIPLTYFEFTTLAAFWLFQQANLDIILLEIGMGGRLDAVNIIDPSISIITTVALDHTEWLGSSRESIGFEKAGILRAGRPIICGDFMPPHSILEKASFLKSPIYLWDRDYRYHLDEHSWDWESKNSTFPKLPLPSLPLQNVATALMAIELLQTDFVITEATIKDCVSRTTIAGRFQYIEPGFILDVAHNPAGAQWLQTKLSSIPIPSHLHAIVGMLADKDIENTFKPLRSFITKWHICELEVNRAASTLLLKDKLNSLGIKNIECYNSVGEAISAVSGEKKSDDLVLIFGSFHTVANALHTLNATEIT